MDNSNKEAKTDLEIQNEIIAVYDKEADRVIKEYLKLYDPDHDMTDFAEFTRHGISAFLHTCHYYKADISTELWDTVIKMYMKLIEPDYQFLRNVRAQIEKTGIN